MRKALFVAVLAGGLAAVAAATASSGGPDWFKTSQGPMIDPVAPGASYEPIISVGDTLPGGYMFESIPDGIAFGRHVTGAVDIYVNHETSTVPFPYNGATGVGFNDFTNSLVSKIRLHQKTGGVPARARTRSVRARTGSASARTSWQRPSTASRSRYSSRTRKASTG